MHFVAVPGGPGPRATRVVQPVIAFAVVIGLLVPTGGVAAPRPAAADRAWVEVRSAHFVVVSDAGERSARRVALQFEQVRSVLLKLWPWARVPDSKPIRVYAARNEATLRSLVPKYWESKGGVRPASVYVGGRDRNFVALRVDVTESDSVEANPYFQTYWAYVSLVLRASFERPLPLWVSRGLADFFANTIVRERDLQVGRVVPWHLRKLREVPFLPLATILAVDRKSPYFTAEAESRLFDASAWAFVHYLTFGEGGSNLARFNQFAQVLRTSGDAAAALRQVYGEQAALEAAVRRYVGQSLFVYQRVVVDIDVTADAFALRSLTVAEASAVQAALHVAMKRPTEARALAQAALQADPSLPGPHESEGLLCDEEDNGATALAAYTRAVALGSTNPFVYYRHAQLLWRAGLDAATLRTIEKSLTRAIALDPDDADSHSYLADIKGDLAQLDEAVTLARRAVALEPGASYHRVALARALIRTHRTADALQEAQKGLSLAANERERQRALEMLEFIRNQHP